MFSPFQHLKPNLLLYSLIPLPDAYRLWASVFVHGGWAHIWEYVSARFGDNIEDCLGRGRYLLFYLGGGVFATLAHGLFVPGSPAPDDRRVGAISVVLGAYIVLFPR